MGGTALALPRTFPEPAPPRGLKDPSQPPHLPSHNLSARGRRLGPLRCLWLFGWSCPHQSVSLGVVPAAPPASRPGLGHSTSSASIGGSELSRGSADAKGTGNVVLPGLLAWRHLPAPSSPSCLHLLPFPLPSSHSPLPGLLVAESPELQGRRLTENPIQADISS